MYPSVRDWEKKNRKKKFNPLVQSVWSIFQDNGRTFFSRLACTQLGQQLSAARRPTRGFDLLNLSTPRWFIYPQVSVCFKKKARGISLSLFFYFPLSLSFGYIYLRIARLLRYSDVAASLFFFYELFLNETRERSPWCLPSFPAVWIRSLGANERSEVLI